MNYFLKGREVTLPFSYLRTCLFFFICVPVWLVCRPITILVYLFVSFSHSIHLYIYIYISKYRRPCLSLYPHRPLSLSISLPPLSLSHSLPLSLSLAFSL